MQHFLSIDQTTVQELDHVIDLTCEYRRQRLRGEPNPPILAGKTLAMIFEKPSLRTRVSFEQAMLDLGGHAMFLRSAEVGLGKREHPADVARVLCGMVHGLMARVYEHQKLLDLAAHSTVPVINALSDQSHPCQALADIVTLIDEFSRDLSGRTLAFVGDGNNVARSLAVICGLYGMHFVIANPPGFDLPTRFVDQIKSQMPNMDFRTTHDPRDAVRFADAIYADTWISMGQEEQSAQRGAAFAAYQLNEDLLSNAPDHAVVLHCMPAYRNLEITDAVIDGPRSRVFQQAHNRLHAQKGLLAVLMGGV